MIVRVVVVLIFGGFGLFMLYVGLTQYMQQRRLLTGAQPVEAEIIESTVKGSKVSTSASSESRITSTRTYEPVVRFRYSVGREQFESDMLRPTIIVRTYPSAESAREELAAYPVGARVTAHVNADRPDKGFLIPEASVGPLVFMIIGVLLPPIAVVVGRYI